MSADDITIMSTFDIRADHLTMFIEAMTANQRNVRAEPGNLEMRMFQDVENQGAFFVFGRTDREIGLESHLEETSERGIADQVATALKAPPVTMTLGQTDPRPVYRETGIRPEANELTVIAVFDLKEGHRERVLAQYEKQVPLVRASDASIVFNVYTVDEDPNRVVVHERWATEQAAHEFSTTQPESIATGQVLAESVVGDLRESVCTVTEIDPY